MTTKPPADRPAIVLPAEGPDHPAPDLVGEHSRRALDLWAHWWSTPMATLWGPFDARSLERLLELMEESWTPRYDRNGNEVGPAGTTLAEIRQLEDRFGLSPAARKKLGWQVEGIDAVDTGDLVPTEDSGPELPKPGSDADPRLRVVQDTA